MNIKMFFYLAKLGADGAKISAPLRPLTVLMSTLFIFLPAVRSRFHARLYVFVVA